MIVDEKMWSEYKETYIREAIKVYDTLDVASNAVIEIFNNKYNKSITIDEAKDHIRDDTNCDWKLVPNGKVYSFYMEHGNIIPKEKFTKVQQVIKLQKIRKEKGISQSKLAELSGVSIRTIQEYEQGRNDINKAYALLVYKLAKALGCGMEDLLDV